MDIDKDIKLLRVGIDILNYLHRRGYGCRILNKTLCRFRRRLKKLLKLKGKSNG